MLRKFNVNINGKDYYVEMEELENGVSPQQSNPSTSPVPSAESGKNETITAPMPGNILKILVNVGDTVSYEQPLVVLEAMKMENELVAPIAGTISKIHITEGSAIDVGEPIISIG